MPDDPNLPNGYVSPLQVENYLANEPCNNLDWFKEMKTASLAVVAREIESQPQ
ncbi:hypothetical protein [Coxiella-like endosymbiont]|uniref:hypothetical protein n=1 Tax=Coxiella-like endosymbiont TaxID=1592897 RepID=UPI00272AF782|nr:hypothetical protein [Coxiella-like endosymbiont]